MGRRLLLLVAIAALVVVMAASAAFAESQAPEGTPGSCPSGVASQGQGANTPFQLTKCDLPTPG